MGDDSPSPVLYEESEAGDEEYLLEDMRSDLEKSSSSPTASRSSTHVAVFVAQWIALSSIIILFNKYILSKTDFSYPILLTSWHMIFATVATQILARCTPLLDSRKESAMTPRTYIRVIVPIGLLFSLCLMCGNIAYIYLTVSFIQMLKASTPVVTILVSWSMGRTPFSLGALGNAAFIVLGVMISSYGEMQFVLVGFIIQLSSVFFDALRLVLMQQLLTTSMDPLVLLYYLSPFCAVMNTLMACFGELPRFAWADVHSAGYLLLLGSALVAFALNISTVVLISKTTSLSMTLCGVLKNILIVLASMLFFHDSVTPLQALGYSLAMCGLLYYQLHGDRTSLEQIRKLLDKAARLWDDNDDDGDRAKPRTTRFWLIILAAVCASLVALVGTLALVGVVPASHFTARFKATSVPAAGEGGRPGGGRWIGSRIHA